MWVEDYKYIVSHPPRLLQNPMSCPMWSCSELIWVLCLLCEPPGISKCPKIQKPKRTLWACKTPANPQALQALKDLCPTLLSFKALERYHRQLRLPNICQELDVSLVEGGTDKGFQAEGFEIIREIKLPYGMHGRIEHKCLNLW